MIGHTWSEHNVKSGPSGLDNGVHYIRDRLAYWDDVFADPTSHAIEPIPTMLCLLEALGEMWKTIPCRTHTVLSAT